MKRSALFGVVLMLALAACTSQPKPSPGVAAKSASPSAVQTPGIIKPTDVTSEPYRSLGNPTSAVAVKCGVERWHVKTGIDAGASKVNMTPKVADIPTLAAFPAPVQPPDARTGTPESQVYSLTATVTSYKVEADSDIHLALSDGKGHTMIAEIPDPGCVGKTSPFAKQIAASRATWSAAHPDTPNYANVKQAVVLTGIGFYDKLHGQRGVAPNGIELHPVLSVVLK